MLTGNDGLLLLSQGLLFFSLLAHVIILILITILSIRINPLLFNKSEW